VRVVYELHVQDDIPPTQIDDEEEEEIPPTIPATIPDEEVARSCLLLAPPIQDR